MTKGNRSITCIMCPLGCDISVQGDKDIITEISGNKCKHGQKYARSEYLDPKRILTTVVKAKGCTLPVVSVRTDKPVPKDKIFDCIEYLRSVTAEKGMKTGTVLVKDILGTGADVILTKKCEGK